MWLDFSQQLGVFHCGAFIYLNDRIFKDFETSLKYFKFLAVLLHLTKWNLFSLFKWLKLTSEDVKEQIFKLAKKGLTPSQIGKFY